MNVLLVEPSASGHHMALYARLVVSAAIRRGWRVHLLTSPEAIEHPATRLVESAAGGDILIHEMPRVILSQRTASASLLVNQVRRLRSMRAGFLRLRAEHRIDQVIVANLDHCDKALAFLGSPFADTPFSGIMMSPKFHRRSMGIGPASRNDALYAWQFRRILRRPHLRGVAVVDEAFFTYVSRQDHQEYKKVYFVPDPGELRGRETREEARGLIGIQNDAFVVLIYGSLTARKGVQQLIDALDSQQGAKVTLVLAGTPDFAVNDIVAGPAARRLLDQSRLVLRFGFHNDEDEYRVFRAANVVWVAYVGGFYGSSGVYYQAASMGLPVLGPTTGLLTWLIARHRNGVCIDPHDTTAVVQAINELSGDKATYQQLQSSALSMAQSHTNARFGEAVCNVVQPK